MIGSPRCSVAPLRLPVLLGMVLLTALTSPPLIPKVASSSLDHLALRSQDTVTLEPGKFIERELKGGETHRYAVTLAAGQYLRVEVEQRGIDVVIAVLSPRSQQLFEFNSDEWLWGTESVCVVAEEAGAYTFQMQARYPGMNPGRYGIQIKELRDTAPADRDRTIAQRYFVEAYQLIFQTAAGQQQTTRDNQLGAATKLAAARQLAQQIGDQELEAVVLHQLAFTHSNYIHDQPKAIEYYEQSLQLLQRLGQRRAQAKAFYGLGLAYTEIGKMSQAREAFQQGLVIFRELGDQQGAGKILNMLGDTYTRESLRVTLDSYLQAAPLLQAAGDIQFEADVRTSMGLAWLLLGEPQQAFAALNRALVLTPLLPWADPKASALDNLSKVHHAAGDYQKALDTQYEALALRQSIGSTEGAANSLHYLAVTYLELGETQRAIDFFQQSVKIRLDLGYNFRTLRSQSEMGIAYNLLGQYQNALSIFQNLLPLTQQNQDRFSEGRTLEGLGLAYQALGEHRKASEFYEQALTVMRALQWGAGESRVLLAKGQAHAALGELPKAIELYRLSLLLARKLNQPYVEAEALSSIARAELKRGNLTEARTHLEVALEIIESVRSRVASPALRASFLATQHSSYESYLALLMKLHRQAPAAGHAVNALQISERARARSFVETLAEAPANIRKGVDPALLNRERELRQKLSAKSAAQNRAASQSEEQVATFSREITELTAELEQIEAQIRTASPRYAALAQPQPLSLPEIQQTVVDADSLLLEYALGEEQSFLFAVTNKTFYSYELPKREVIETAARRYYELLTARNRTVKFEEPAQRTARIRQADKDLIAAGAELSQMILEPIATELGNQRLLIVADGALQLIPFAALPVPTRNKEKVNRYSATVPLLLDKHFISYLPSATALAQLRRDLKDRQIAPKTLAVFADPVFEPDDERLPKNTRDQLARVRQSVPTGKDNLVAPKLDAEQLTRAIRDADAEDERGGLARLRYTREEANSVLALVPNSEVFSALDFDATQEAALNPALSQYRYVHFATHGLIDNIHPDLSGLVLSRFDRQGRALDGHLRLVEISNLNLPAELAVLSACKSGIGKEVRGEGLQSLTRGFMHAGAARVLVSLWDVNDKSTASLMAEFYRGLLRQRLSPSQALRTAQLRMRHSAAWSSPYFWAAFVQHGEPQ
ncbi:MAG TPA: CHAT domain-containing protein [Blastocatellia bacterium]|nr:CHAT domain-containing protein [Blastocatellia bacterium]